MRSFPAAALATLVAACHAHAQIEMTKFTIDCGGGASAGGTFDLVGTIGQHDAAPAMSGGDFDLFGGFWPDSSALSCYANCDASTTPPVANVADFICFQNQFAAGSADANCDNSTTPPVLNVADFICFLNAFAAGCP